MLTHRQQQVLDLIREQIKDTGLPPTRAEIAQKLGFRSATAAADHLKALARKGAIELLSGSSRGIRLLNQGVPLIGRVAAGAPILAQEQVESWHQLDSNLFSASVDYLLRVQGASMRDLGILDGDLLAVHRQPVADNGQIVVARVDDEVTVKRLQREGHRVLLLPENPEFPPIEIDLRRDPLVIEGIALGVVRTGLL